MVPYAIDEIQHQMQNVNSVGEKTLNGWLKSLQCKSLLQKKKPGKINLTWELL
jgi:hypothetical protein